MCNVKCAPRPPAIDIEKWSNDPAIMLMATVQIYTRYIYISYGKIQIVQTFMNLNEQCTLYMHNRNEDVIVKDVNL